MDATTNAPEPRFRSRSRIALALTGAAMLSAALLAFHGLDNNPFWEDEAQSALLARNLLHTGTLTGWDGTNVVGFEYGDEFDENLHYVKIPPQHFYLAASGFALFGETTFGGRAPFVIVGVLAVAALAWWARRYFGRDFPWWLPAFILALTPAFLLFIRNCRYFSPGFFWTTLLLGLWSISPGTNGKSGRWPAWLRGALAALATLGLFTNYYFYAFAALGTLPVFFLLPRYRLRSQGVLLGVIYGVGFACTCWALLQGAASDRFFTRDESVSWAANAGILFLRAIRDVATHEFFAWPMLLPLALPWCVARLRDHRDRAKAGWVLAVAMLAYLAVVALLSQQPVAMSAGSNARYYAPIILFGALVSATSLCLLWRIRAALGIGVAVLLIATNFLYLIPQPGPSTRGTNPARFRSRLLDYVRENVSPPQSAYARLVAWAQPIAPGTRVYVIPNFVAYPLMFYRPDVIYCEQLEIEKTIHPDLRAALSDDLFVGTSRPDLIALHPMDAQISTEQKTLMFPRPLLGVKPLRFDFRGTVPTQWRGQSRPEIPDHLFRTPPERFLQPGFWIYQRVQPPVSPPPAAAAPPPAATAP